MVNMEEVEVGWGVEKGYNGDCYPYYIVGIERGKSSYNKNKIKGLWVVPAQAICSAYYTGEWEVEPYDPEKHTMKNAFYIRATRKHPSEFSVNGRDWGVWNYKVCKHPHRSSNPSF